jgi:protease secretion system membrane fusion protein
MKMNMPTNPTATEVTDVNPKPEPGGPLDERSYSRWGWIIVLAGVLGSLGWMAVAPLDQGVQVQGTVIVAGNRKSVQHPTGGIVDEVLVREGDVVKAGQVLARMNVTQARAEAEMMRFQVLTGRAMEARLKAEDTGAAAVKFPALLISDATSKADPRVPSLLQLQLQLFASRRAALQSELASMDQSIQGVEFQLKGLLQSRQEKRSQLITMDEQLTNMRELAIEGYVPRNRMLELDRQSAQLKGALAEDTGNIGRLEKQIQEVTMRKEQRLQEYKKEVRSQLTEIQRDTESAAQRLAAADFALSNTEVKSPADGAVVALSVFTPGAVISPGFRIMDVVPQDARLEIEGQVPVHLIDKVKPELPVELMFTAFNQRKTPHIAGVVTKVSADRLTDEKTGAPYFKLYAEATAAGIVRLRDEKVRPGMPVEVFVKTGERTMLNYLIRPILDRVHSALREE